mmetsp:Transcript_12614/g.23655  ORF Transcript_12614/g.23655 Transcript_12614/m.23655 type:complete len:107 (+) Transcript_12614:620-940(+)
MDYGYLIVEDEKEKNFHRWLQTTYDDYPFLKTCWNINVSVLDIERCIDEHGIECVLQVERITQTNGFELLLMNPFIGNEVFDMIDDIVLGLVMRWQEYNVNTGCRF